MMTMRRAFVSFVLLVCVLAAGGGLLSWLVTRGAVAASERADVDWAQTDRAKVVTARVAQRLAHHDGVASVKALDGLPPAFTITLDDSVDWEDLASRMSAACRSSASEYPNVTAHTEVFCYVTQATHLNTITDRLAASLEALPGVSSVKIDSVRPPR